MARVEKVMKLSSGKRRNAGRRYEQLRSSLSPYERG